MSDGRGAGRSLSSLPGPSSRILRLDLACDRFEADWGIGPRPRIEDYLEDFAEAERGLVLRELIALELELLPRRDGRPTPSSYRDRFPGQDVIIRSLFAEGPTASPSGPAGMDEPIPIGPIRGDGPPPVGEPACPVERVGDYELLGEIARGGMGVVYRARQLSLNRIVALKMIRSGRFASEEEIHRFRREVEVTASLDHPNIVPIYEVGRHRGRPYFSMKLIEGRSLADHLPRLLGEPRAAAQLMVIVSRAVNEAHRRGFVHRDLKPANILIDGEGQPHITDFGLAKRIDDDSSLTESGMVLGTPDYMAPEQAAGRADIAAATDVYALGAILYVLLTGRPPFRGATGMEMLVQILELEPEPPSRGRPGIPRDLEAICLQCLEKNPGDRYLSAAALADDLECYLREEGVKAGRSGLLVRLARQARREPELACRLLGLTAVGALTQLNFAADPRPNAIVHLATSAVEIAWLLSSLAFHRLLGKGIRTDWVRPAWIIADIALLTALLRILNATASSLIIGFTLVVAASGLWSRTGLVWLTTSLACSGYAALALDASLRGIASDHNHHPNIILACLAIIGFVVAQQVKRFRILSSYYDHSPPP
ncbi:serine/threonine-protein kinase [Tundrisphaera lichenicola]|uniref:serine/threonine-protein kinase n=1 Tax=Tundrisphaera lichenicola TaxID=2029860 RepID=UPI003EBC0C02